MEQETPVPKGFDQHEIIAIINQIITSEKSRSHRICRGQPFIRF